MNQTSWLPNLITEDKDDDLVQLVLHSLNFDKKMIRAFAVAASNTWRRRVSAVAVAADQSWGAASSP
jgi:hypothetical protein